MSAARRSLAIARWLWRFRVVLLLCAVSITVAALTQLTSLQVSNSLQMWYPQDDPALIDYLDFQERFGSDEIVVIAVTSEGGFASAAGMEQIADLTDRLYYVDGVASVTSVSTVPQNLRQAQDRLLSRDGSSTALLVQMSAGDNLEQQRHAILADLAQAVDEYRLPASFAGYGVIYDSLNQASTEDSARLLIVAHLVMLALLAVFFRRIGPVIVTLLAVGVATIWTMGIYAAFGQQINMVTMALPTLVLIIGVADCVHLLRSVARQPGKRNRQTRIIRGIAAVIGPCVLTSITTAIGFVALTTSELPVVQSLGAFAAIGMLAALAASVIVVTASLSLSCSEVIVENRFLEVTAERLANAGRRFAKPVIGLFAIFAIVATSGMTRLETDTFSIAYLSDTHQARLDSDFIEAEIGPYAPIDYVVRSTDVLQGDVLDSLQSWQRAVGEIEGIGWSWSLLDALDIDANQAPSYIGRQSITSELARLRLLSPAVADSMIHGETELRVTFGAPMMSAQSVRELLLQIEHKAEFPPGVSVHAAGYANLYTHIVGRIVNSQILGFAIALILILTAILFATRSVPRMLLAVPANLLPVAATLGLMGWCGIPLDVATATIATVILGLIVDDSIHILAPGSRRGHNLSSSTTSAVQRAGSSLIMTSVILCGGFLVMAFAEIRTIAWFGLLTAFALVCAIVTDLLLLPALAAVRRPQNALLAHRGSFAAAGPPGVK